MRAASFRARKGVIQDDLLCLDALDRRARAVPRETAQRLFGGVPEASGAFRATGQSATSGTRLVESSQTCLLQLLDDAVDAIQNAVIDGKVDVAMELLKTMGSMKKPNLGKATRDKGQEPAEPPDA
jgi:hypothetical protein